MQRREKKVPQCPLNSISLDLLALKILSFGGLNDMHKPMVTEAQVVGVWLPAQLLLHPWKRKRYACGWDFLRLALVFTSCALTLGFLCLCHLSFCVRVPCFSVCDIKGQGLEGSSRQDKPCSGHRWQAKCPCIILSQVWMSDYFSPLLQDQTKAHSLGVRENTVKKGGIWD